ncbi:MAG: hypothetical protein OEZ34_16830, partial [Spirochaetia bacterium]|nr:hypothetical protein [Spirochaetia bacterium]
MTPGLSWKLINAVRFRDKLIIFLASAALFTAAVWFLPGFIEKKISDQLDTALIKNALSQNITERTGLTVKIQGLRFDLWHGLIFTGIRLYPSSERIEKTYLIHIENLILNISYWNMIRRKELFSVIRLRGGKMNPYSLNFSEWTALARSLTKSSDTDMDFSKNSSTSLWEKITHPENHIKNFKNPKIIAENIRISLPLRKHGVSGKPSKIKFQFGAEMIENGYEYKFSLLEGNHDVRILEGKGRWSSIDSGKLYFQLYEFPIHIMSRIFSSSNLIPDEIEEIPVSLDDGYLNGKGSISFLKIGLALNLDGETDNLEANIPNEDLSFLSIRGKSTFNFNTGIDTESGNTAFIKFSLKQKHLDFKASYEDLFFKGAVDGKKIIAFSAKTFFSEDKKVSPVLPFLNAKGDLSAAVKISYREKPFFAEPEGHIEINNTSLSFPEEIFPSLNQKIKNNILSINNLSLDLGKEMVLIGKGNLLDSDISVSAVSPLKISKNGNETIYNQKWEGN